MAQLISVKLSRFDNSPWGFRLQGGKDFGTPLVVQKVNGGSPAEAAGLRAGDAVIKVNNTDTFNLRHKDAQDVIVRAGNNFEVTIQRGGSTWKPSVTPVSATLPTPKPSSPASNISPVTKTSLAAKKQDGPLIGSGHNFSPKPFLNGNGEAPIKSIVNKQYNSPVGIYSEETIAETLSAQAEVLAGGVLGVNFKKNEKNYNAENSEVFKMVQEADKEPRSPEPAEPAIQSGAVTPTNPAAVGLTGLRHVSAPETKPQPTTPQANLPPGQNICADCERLIVGVFVRIKEKNLHVECFKCSTCGTSLKNVGYYNINNKLYCDIHAKLVARQNPPASGLIPVTIPPGKAPAGTISAALANVGASIPPLAPLSPSLNNHSSPQAFSSHLGASPLSTPVLRPVQAPSTNNIGGPKPFGGAPTAPSLVSTPSLNSGSNTLPRPQSQNASDSYYEESDYYEVIETLSENPPSPPPPPPSVKSKSLVWPPAKPIEEITYPTASPLYINPNPALNQRHQRSLNEVRQIQVMAEPKEVEIQREEPICPPGPVYRRVQLYGLTDQRESRSREATCSRTCSRAASRESLRRSLTPTRITQPTPQPWTATVTTGINLYEPCPPAQPIICHDVCEERKICKKQVTCENQVCQSQQTCERKQIHHHHHHHHHQVCQSDQQSSRPAYRAVCPPKPPQQVCLFKSAPEPQPEPEPEPTPESPIVQTEVSFTFRRPNSANLSEVVPPSVAVCPQGIEGQHDYLTETTEKDVGPIHIKKTTIYEKTVEVVDAEDEEQTESREEIKKNTSIESEIEKNTTSQNSDEEVESISERRDIAESAEIVSSAVDTQQLVEQIKHEEQESLEAERAAATEQISSSVHTNQGKRLSFSEHQDLEGGGYVDRHETVQEDDSARYEELTEEIRIQDSFRHQEIEQQRRQSLREQVEVHQCLREQQIPERRQPPQTLQERRLSARFSQQDFQCSQQQATEVSCPKKHVQFVQETERGIKPLPPTTIKNSTPKQWQSEMVKALTTAPVRAYSPLTTEANNDDYVEEFCTEAKTCEEVTEVRTIEVQQQQRSASPFQSALTTASDRPYTPLGFYDQPACQYSADACCRSQAPNVQANPGPDGYCAPAEILYMDSTAQEAPKRETKIPVRSMTPQPLPTPPPDYHLRDSSLPRSRSQTPSNRSFMTGLKKPGAIPAYQRNLISTQKNPVEGQTYAPSRSPTPARCRSKSPGQALSEPPSSYIRAQAPKIRDDPPPKVKPTSVNRQNKKPEEEGESYTYHEEKTTPRGRLITDVEGSMRVAYAGDEQSFVASEKEVIETLKEIRKPVCDVKEAHVPIVMECQPKTQPQPQYASSQKSACLITNQNNSQVTLPCPMGKSQSDRFPRTGVCVLPPCPKTIVGSQSQSPNRSAFCGTQSTTQRTVSQSQRSAFCGTKSKTCYETGVTVVPCKAVSESGTKTALVVLPTEGDRGCTQVGVNIVPTSDRRGLCVSPGLGSDKNRCGQPSESCGRRSSSAALDIGGTGGFGPGSKSGAVAGNTAPNRGRGILTQQGGPGSRVPLCGHCNSYVRGPFITALGNIWCPDHFVCVNAQCRRPLQDIGFVEEKGQLYCEYCFEQYIAPPCSKCNNKIKGECLNAIGKHFHPECFNCSYCGKLFGNNPFFLEDGLPYCEADWNELFTTKCFSCGFPVEAGDRWVEALSNNYHSQCFNCTMCKKNLEGQSFYAKGGRPFCKNHAR